MINLEDLTVNLAEFQTDYNKTSIALSEIDISSIVSPVYEAGKISVVASRPGMGKSTFLCQTAVNSCLINKVNCCYFCLFQDGDRIRNILLHQLNSIKTTSRAKLLFHHVGIISIDELSSMVFNEVKDGIVIIDGIEQIKSPSNRRTISVLKQIAIKNNVAIVLSSCLPKIFQKLSDKNEIVDRLKYLSFFDNILLMHRESFDTNNINNSSYVEILMPKSKLSDKIIIEYLGDKCCYKIKRSMNNSNCFMVLK